MVAKNVVKESYEQLLYQCASLPEAHLERLWSIGNLFGIKAELPSKSRVLEIGCGTGAHITPLAFQYPKSSFVGVEISEEHSKIGTQQIEQLGLSNIEIRNESLSKLINQKERYDYIIAHGLYSWIKPELQEALFSIGDKLLTDNGLFYLSFNTLPGWYTKLRARDIALSATNDSMSAKEKIHAAREALESYRSFCSKEKPDYAKDLEPLLENLKKAPDWYLFHEYLAPYNSPEYFESFMNKAEANNLHYVADADLTMSYNQPLEAKEYSKDVSESTRFTPSYEQANDIYSNRVMRRAILSKQKPNFSPKEAGKFIESAVLASPAKKFTQSLSSRTSGITFRIGDRGTVSVDNQSTAKLLTELGEIWPCSMKADSFKGEIVSEDLVTLFFEGALLVENEEMICAKTISEKPRVSDLTRLQLSQSHIASGIRGEKITFDNALARLVTFFLEGEADEESLFSILQNVEVSFGEEDKNLDLDNLTKQHYEHWYKNVCQKLMDAGLLLVD